MKKKTKEALTGYLFLLPTIGILAVFIFGPLIFSFYVSFHEWNMLMPLNKMPFVGLKNYAHILFEDPVFYPALSNTLVYTLYVVPGTVLIALFLALLVNSVAARFRTVARVIFFIPIVVSLVVVSIIWRDMLYQPVWGVLNQILRGLGLKGINWIVDYPLLSVALMSIWQVSGLQMVIFLAGLQDIPEVLYEAAEIDGANWWWRFRSVTFPGLKRVFFFVVATTLIGSFLVFIPFYMLIGTRPPINATVLPIYIYDTSFSYLRFGKASAMSYILFVIIYGVTLIQMRLFRERGPTT